MSNGTATGNEFVQYVFHRVALPDYGVQLQVNLHIADPGPDGTATSFEPTYVGYAPILADADTLTWTLCNAAPPYAPNASGAAVKNAADLAFPACTDGSDNVTHASVSVIGSGQLLYVGALTFPALISSPYIPRFPAGSVVLAQL